MKTPVKFYPVPPRNPNLDPFRGRQWSESALFPAAPRLRRVARRFQPSGRVFVIEQDCRRFVVVATDVIKANQRFNSIYP